MQGMCLSFSMVVSSVRLTFAEWLCLKMSLLYSYFTGKALCEDRLKMQQPFFENGLQIIGKQGSE